MVIFAATLLIGLKTQFDILTDGRHCICDKESHVLETTHFVPVYNMCTLLFTSVCLPHSGMPNLFLLEGQI